MIQKVNQIEQNLDFRRYSKNPTADWIVLLPGAGAAAAVWRRQIPYLRRTFNLLVIDLPGHGRSPKGSDSDAYTFSSIAARVMALMQSESIERAHLLSMSLGGLVAETIALLCPERVQSLVLAGGVAKLSLWATTLMYVGRAASQIVPYMVLYRALAWIMMPGSNHAPTRRLFSAHARRLGRREFLRWYRLSREVKALTRRCASRSSFIPTLFVMGDADYMFYRYAVERARSRPDTAVATIANCGHVCSVEHPDEFNKVAEQFLLGLREFRGRRVTSHK